MTEADILTWENPRSHVERMQGPAHGRLASPIRPKVLWTGGAKVALRWGSSPRILWIGRGPA